MIAAYVARRITAWWITSPYRLDRELAHRYQP